MDLVDTLAHGLARPGASEFAVTSGRLPCVMVNGSYEAVAKDPVSTDLILVLLVTLGGLRHIDSLSAQPSQWKTDVDGIGSLTVVAVRNGDVVKARCVPSPPSPVRKPSGQMLQLDHDPSRKSDPRPNALSGVPPILGGRSEASTPPRKPSRKPSFSDAGVRRRPSLELDFQPPAPELTPELDAFAPALAPALAPASDFAPAPAPASIPAPTFAFASAPAPAPITLASLLVEARRRSASDLHIVATRPPLYRVAGDLLPDGTAPLDPTFVEQILLACIPPRLAATFEKDGSCDFALLDEESGRFRVNIARQRTGLKGCFRLIGSEVRSLEALELPDSIALATEHHQGLIVITGPTGHGKTTTLAALVDLLNTTTRHHILTVEDPIEYVHQRKMAVISQREVGSHTRSFAAALKASLREDPDIIVVGELRDTDTVRMAIAASETGHLVIGTMNTPSAAKTIDRLIDLFPPGDQPQVRVMLAGGLRLIVSQRLVRSADGTRVHAAAELLPGNTALWNLIRDSKTFQIPSLQQRGKALGIIRLDDSLAELVKSGKVTLEAAQAFSEAPEELANQVRALEAPPKVVAAKPEPGFLARAGALVSRKEG